VAPLRPEKPTKIKIDTKIPHAFIPAAYRSSRYPAGRVHIRINRHCNKFLPFEPFISQVPADQCLQQISRILCPAAQGGAVSPRKIATPIHPRVRIFPSHLSIRPDSPCRRPSEHGRPPLLDSAALPSELHSTQIAAPCQSPISRAVIDDHDLFLAPGLAKRRADSIRKWESGLK